MNVLPPVNQIIGEVLNFFGYVHRQYSALMVLSGFSLRFYLNDFKVGLLWVQAGIPLRALETGARNTLKSREGLVEPRRIELPTFALRNQPS